MIFYLILVWEKVWAFKNMYKQNICLHHRYYKCIRFLSFNLIWFIAKHFLLFNRFIYLFFIKNYLNISLYFCVLVCDDYIYSNLAPEMADMRQENKNLYKRIEDLKNELKDLQTQVSKLHDELANQYKMYRDEKDARKLLQSDINDLRYQAEDYQMSQKQDAEEEEDPVMLKIALK